MSAFTVERIDRLAIIARDRGICYICGKRPGIEDVTLDHVIPLAKGGSHASDNLKVACLGCNLRKHTRLPSETPTYMPLFSDLV
jgi:5-methylcytosine-specific restriction endonuclease McrA